MRGFIIVFAALLVPIGAVHAQLQTDSPQNKKLCINLSALELPKIPGLTITASRTSPPNKENPGCLVMVEIDVNAAAEKSTFLFCCLDDAHGGLLVTPLGLYR